MPSISGPRSIVASDSTVTPFVPGAGCSSLVALSSLDSQDGRTRCGRPATDGGRGAWLRATSSASVRRPRTRHMRAFMSSRGQDRSKAPVLMASSLRWPGPSSRGGGFRTHPSVNDPAGGGGVWPADRLHAIEPRALRPPPAREAQTQACRVEEEGVMSDASSGWRGEPAGDTGAGLRSPVLEPLRGVPVLGPAHSRTSCPTPSCPFSARPGGWQAS